MDNVFPAGFVDRMRGLLGEELDPFLRALAEPAVGLRVNTLRVSAEEFAARRVLPVERLAFPAQGFAVQGDVRAGRHPYHAAGVYYLQDPGAMAVGALVEPQPGERVLDLSAAPGGKATHLAALMGNDGLLIANDPSRPRAQELAGNLERCGVMNAIVLSERPERLATHFGAWFDRVLLDAPCSGESMFHKSSAAREGWSEAAVIGCARRQGDLIATAAEMVRPGGVLVYSTCTFSREENEDVISAFLGRHPDFALDAMPAVPGADLVDTAGGGGGEGAYRLWPHRVTGAGHFVARFRRSEDADAAELRPWQPRASGEAARLFRELTDRVYSEMPVDEGRLTLLGRELYALPEDAPVLQGLSVVRPGLWCATLEGRRLEPQHALSMIPDASPTAPVELTLHDVRVGQYLTGNTIEADGEPGWVPVHVDGFPLGWGKRVAGIVKNHYPKGLRWNTPKG